MQMIDRVAGVQPLGVTIVNEREAIAELKEDDPIINVSQLIQGLASWEGQSVNVSSVISSKRSLLSIIQEGDEMRSKQKELEREQQLIRDEVREWWQELDFERQMIRKEAEAKGEELEDKQKLLKGEQSDYRGQKICWSISMSKWLRLSCFRMNPPHCVFRYSYSKPISGNLGGQNYGTPMN